MEKNFKKVQYSSCWQKKVMLWTFSLSLLLTSDVLYSQTVPQDLELREIFFEPLLSGLRPNLSGFSPDGSTIYFTWNDTAGTDRSLWQVNVDGNGREQAPDTARTSYQMSPSGEKIVYTTNGDLVLNTMDFTNPRVLVSSASGISGVEWSPDESRIAYTSRGEVWVVDVAEFTLRQVTTRPNGSHPYTISDWVGNEMLLLRQSDNENSRTVYFPRYHDEFVTPGASSRGITDIIYSVVDVESREIEVLMGGRHRSSASGSPAGRYVAIDYTDAALKKREIRIYDLEENRRRRRSSTLFRDKTEGWLHGTRMEFSPDGSRIMFQSEKENWNHIYSVRPDGSDLVRHTSGEFDIPWTAWVDANSILFASTEVDPGERHLYLLSVSENRIRKLTTTEAYRNSFELSPDRDKVVYAKSFFNEPYDLFLLDLDYPGEEVRLTESVPERFHSFDWQQEEYVRFTGRDGETELSMSVLYPENFSPEGSRPVVVFVHGAGSLQNVFKGWSNSYYREYMFHQFLIGQGYVVIEVDYRHSTGYGRKFREDVTNWMGRYETEDIVDGLDWVQENRGGLNLDRVGIYGGSYGGFMALYATSTKPDRFHAAAALRAVTNWRNYYYANPHYTKPRLGTPEENPEHYDRSSPLTYASEMERPVLMLHGLIDDNVGFQDAAQYIEELIQSGHEELDMMMYPSERHSFTSPASWYDEYRRIYQFFEKYLK
ncbi:MAG: alpha/beta fold hydrolase [Balneolaceae bacterium]